MTIDFHVEVEEIENKIVLCIDGRLDAASYPILEKKIDALINEGHYHVILDFSRIDYLSSSGLRLLLSKSKKLKIKNGNLVIHSVDDEVMQVIKLAGFDKILNIFESEEQALQFFEK